jgi:hypothetical protein
VPDCSKWKCELLDQLMLDCEICQLSFLWDAVDLCSFCKQTEQEKLKKIHSGEAFKLQLGKYNFVLLMTCLV